jgi:Mn-dependent DtxR family transcriptional regulator
MIQGTSLLAYTGILEELGERQFDVYRVLAIKGALNNTQIAKELNLPINSITGRVYELRMMGVVIQDRKDQCPITKKQTIFWKVKHKLQ